MTENSGAVSAGRWREGVVRIDGFGPFPAEIDTQVRWNGWACPRFTREIAEQIAEASTKPPPGNPSLPPDYSSWHWRADVLVMKVNPEVTDYGPVESDYFDEWAPDDDGKYHVGAYAWTWDDEEPGRDPSPALKGPVT
jgi:hypothetical protein